MKKKLILLALSAGLVAPMQAQLFSPESLTGAALGGIAGGIIGHNSGRHGGEGAAVGAGVGLLVGSLAHQDRRERGYYHVGYDQPYYYHRPNYALGGAVLGGVAGAVIGHNSGRHGAEGAAIGAGAGLLFGSIAESEARRRASARAASLQYARVAQVTQPAPATQSSPPPRVVAREAKISAMSGANRLFGR
jgi:outer membrane lipoprotein SlyB